MNWWTCTEVDEVTMSYISWGSDLISVLVPSSYLGMSYWKQEMKGMYLFWKEGESQVKFTLLAVWRHWDSGAHNLFPLLVDFCNIAISTPLCCFLLSLPASRWLYSFEGVSSHIAVSPALQAWSTYLLQITLLHSCCVLPPSDNGGALFWMTSTTIMCACSFRVVSSSHF